MTGKPTITVDLETLALAVGEHPDADAAREELGEWVAKRKHELESTMNEEPTITIPISKLKAVVQGPPEGKPYYEELNELRELIAERERGVRAPSGEWVAGYYWLHVGDDMEKIWSLHDRRNGQRLCPADVRRAAMAPELAKALREAMDAITMPEYGQWPKDVRALLARFDNPEGTDGR